MPKPSAASIGRIGQGGDAGRWLARRRNSPSTVSGGAAPRSSRSSSAGERAHGDQVGRALAGRRPVGASHQESIW